MSKRLLSFASVVLAVLCTGESHGHVGERIIPIRELTDAALAEIDIYDGSVADWESVLGEPTLTAADFSAYYRFASYDPADLDYRVWLGWHRATSRIFAAVERVDDVYVNQFEYGTITDGSFTNHDSGVKLEIDGDHSGGIFYPNDLDCCGTLAGWKQQAHRQAQWYEGIAEVQEGPQILLLAFAGDWFLNEPFADGGGGIFGENPVVTVTEFYATAFDVLDKDGASQSQPSQLAPGGIIGLRMMIPDYDTSDRLSRGGTSFTPSPNALHGMPQVFDSIEALLSADFFADALLVGFDGEGEVTAVRDGSWARIKAAIGE